MEKLTAGSITINYHLRSSKKSKRVNIKIKNGEVIVSKPEKLSKHQAKKYVELNKNWIINKLQEYEEYKSKLPHKKFVTGERFPYRGEAYILQVKPGTNKRTSIKCELNTLNVYISQDLAPKEQTEEVKDKLYKWYKKQAKEIFYEKLKTYSNFMKLDFNNLRIKDQKTRWGSCSNKGNINLNWRLILAPDKVSDYIIIHELCHLKYLNHSPSFWKCVEYCMPDYINWKNWLKNRGHELFI